MPNPIPKIRGSCTERAGVQPTHQTLKRGIMWHPQNVIFLPFFSCLLPGGCPRAGLCCPQAPWLAVGQSIVWVFFTPNVFGVAIQNIFFIVPSVAPGFLLVHPCPQHHFLTAFPTPPITGAAMSFSGFFRATSPRCPPEEDNAVSSVSWAGTERF